MLCSSSCCCPTFYHRCPPPAPPAPDRETRCSLFLGTTLWHSSCHTRKIIAKLPPFTNCSISVPSPFAGSLFNAQPFHLSPSAVITPKHHPAPPAPLGTLLAACQQSLSKTWRLQSQVMHQSSRPFSVRFLFCSSGISHSTISSEHSWTYRVILTPNPTGGPPIQFQQGIFHYCMCVCVCQHANEEEKRNSYQQRLC